MKTRSSTPKDTRATQRAGHWKLGEGCVICPRCRTEFRAATLSDGYRIAKSHDRLDCRPGRAAQ